MSIQSIAMQNSIAATTIATQPTGNAPPARAAVADEASTNTARADATGNQALGSAASPAEKKQQVEAAVKAVKEFIQPMAGNLEFQMDEETGETVIKIVDSSSGELIRQIPSKEMLEIAKALDRLQGILVKQKA